MPQGSMDPPVSVPELECPESMVPAPPVPVDPSPPNRDLSGPVTFFASARPGPLQATEDIPSPSLLLLLLVMRPAPCS